MSNISRGHIIDWRSPFGIHPTIWPYGNTFDVRLNRYVKEEEEEEDAEKRILLFIVYI